MKNIAFFKVGGLCAGGIEKHLHLIASSLDKTKYNVDFYYTESTRSGNWRHPPTDLWQKNFLMKNGVKLIEVYAESMQPLEQGGNLNNSNFFEIFDETKYDIVVGATKGMSYHPFCVLRCPKIIEIVHGTQISCASQYASKYILISDYQMSEWKRAGGDLRKTEVIYPPVFIPEIKCLKKLQNKIRIGMHQANRSDIFSAIPLDAFKKIQDEFNNVEYIILGGSQQYSEHAIKNNIQNFQQLDFTSDPIVIHEFLSSLDIFAHGRKDGEVCSTAIIEAMHHGVPIISHKSSVNNGHYYQIKDCGFWAENEENYCIFLKNLLSSKELRQNIKEKTLIEYEKKFNYQICLSRLLQIFEEI